MKVKVVAQWCVRGELIPQFLENAKKLVVETNKEPGCIYYQLHKDAVINQYAFIEEYENKEALEAHCNTTHFKTLVPLLETFTFRPVVVNRYTLLDLESADFVSGKAGRDALGY